MKIQVNHDFKDNIKVLLEQAGDDTNVQFQASIGENSGYQYVVTEKAVYFVGRRLFNLTANGIMKAEILPFVYDSPVFVPEAENTIDKVFEFKPGIVYYCVEFDGGNPREAYSYVFDDLNDALSMIGAYVQYKSMALIRKED